jgi:hypothetical protein
MVLAPSRSRSAGDPVRSTGVSTRFGIAGDESKRGPGAASRAGIASAANVLSSAPGAVGAAGNARAGVGSA